MADVMVPGEPCTRLIDAVKRGQPADVQVLVESDPLLAGARDASGVSAILIALYHGHRDIARWLAARRTDLDIFEASALGNVERVTTLLAADPSLVRALSPDGFPALGLASFCGALPAVRALLAAGADPNAAGSNAAGYTPLTGAVASRSVDVVSELLQNGGNPNQRYGPGYTPLHEAAASGSHEIAELLVKAGASAGAKTDAGLTPLELAREKGHQRVVDLLAGR